MGDRLLKVVAVSARAGIAWVKGQASDNDLLIAKHRFTECVYLHNLPDLASYRVALRLCTRFRDQGAVCLICRTKNPIVARHLEKNGAVPGFTDSEGGRRYLAPPKAFSGWLAKWTIQSPSPCSKRSP